MNWLTQFDTWSINCTEKRITHPIQRWTGLNNFDLMPWSVVFFFITSLLPGIILRDYRLCLLSIVLTIFPCIFMQIGLRFMKPAAMRALDWGCANPEKKYPGVRTFFALVLLLSLYFLVFDPWGINNNRFFGNLTVIIMGMSVYFQLILMACNPLEPAKSKLKKFLESFVPQSELKPIRIRK